MGVFKELNLNPNLPKALTFIPVFWHPTHPAQWIKVNFDGLSKGNPGPVVSGVVFWDPTGNYKGACDKPLGTQTSYFAELEGLITKIEEAQTIGWINLWIEGDSNTIVSYDLKPNFNPFGTSKPNG